VSFDSALFDAVVVEKSLAIFIFARAAEPMKASAGGP
jgi:hypothetical protein